jgi:putative MATE family efflux protein
MVARRAGEKDLDGAANAGVQGIAVGVIMSLILGSIGVMFAPQLLTLMGASQQVIDNGVGFARVMLGGNMSILLLFLTNAVFRGVGDATLAMRTLWIANAINITLAPCLIFGVGPFPELGVTGAAVGTTIGRGVGALFGMTQLFRRGSRLVLQKRHLRLNPSLMWRLVTLSASGTLQVFIGTASWIGLMRIIASFGSDAIAAFTIAIRIVLFALFPCFGLGNAAATMVGQALGARDPGRAERAVWLAARYNVAFLGAVGIFLLVTAGPIVGFFSAAPGVIAYAVDALRVLAVGFVFFAFGMVLSQAFNGAGDTWTPTWLNLFAFWLCELPLGYVLAVTLAMGPHGVFLASAGAMVLFAGMSVVAFRRGTWKTKVL